MSSKNFSEIFQAVYMSDCSDDEVYRVVGKLMKEKTVNNYLTPEQIEAARKSILEAEDERILSLMKESNTEMLDLSLEKEHMTKLIASGLNVEKELEQYRGKLLADEQHQFESEVLQKIQQVKENIAKICKETLSEHQCQGVVPGTFIACGEGDYQYCSEACLTIAKQAKTIQLAYKERDAVQAELDFIHQEYVAVEDSELTRDALLLKIAALSQEIKTLKSKIQKLEEK